MVSLPTANELPPHLATWVREPGPAKVVAEIRRRAERGHSTDRGTLRCELDETERKQVGRLLGVQWELSGRSVRLQDLATRLERTPLELAEAVTGPIVTRAELRAQVAAEAAVELADARDRLVHAGVPGEAADRWLADPATPRPGSGLTRLVGQVAVAWSAVPEVPTHLARLAADLFGDAHTLDADQALGRAVARLAATVHGLDRPRRSGPSWRAAWAAIGVLCNEVSSRVLALNLPLRGAAPAAALAGAAPGEPVWLTLRSLAGDWTASGRTVFVCENPTVVEAAADRFGAACPPLVCTDGMASAAALRLIGGLAEAGCAVRARADFDKAGFVIVEQIRSAAPGMTLWRFDAETYALAGGGPAAFGPDGRAVHEEAVLALLLADLGSLRGT